MKLIQYISTTYVREELYNPDNWDLINPKSPPEFISSGGPFCHKVELEGFEPSSKRGNHKLSTCLSLPNFSCNGRTKAINHCLILLSFTQNARPLQAIPDVTAPLNRNASEQQLPSDVSSWHLVPGLS